MTRHSEASEIVDQVIKQERDRLRIRVRESEQRSALASAKKESLKTENFALADEANKAKSRADALSIETKLAFDEVKIWKARAQDAAKAIQIMRENHQKEIRLIQKSASSNVSRASELADIIDHLGRSVLQKEDALRERAKISQQLDESRQEVALALSERNRLKRTIVDLDKRLAKTERLNKLMLKGRDVHDASEGAASDQSLHFEERLRAFETRYAVLGEGSLGSEFYLRKQEEEIIALLGRIGVLESDTTSLREDAEGWRTMVTHKDLEINSLKVELVNLEDRMHSSVQAEASAREDLAKVQLELDSFRALIEEERRQRDIARLEELGRMKSSYEDELKRQFIECQRKDSFDAKGPDGGQVITAKTPIREVAAPVQLVTHTGEIAEMSVIQNLDTGRYSLKAVRQLENGKKELGFLELNEKQVESGSSGDGEGWVDLVYAAGYVVDHKTNKLKLVLPELVLSETIFMPPSSIPVVLSVFRYDSKNYYISGFDDIQQRLVDLKIQLSEGDDDVDKIVRKLALHQKDDGGLVMVYDR